MDDFIYFSDDPNVERLFEQLLSSLVTVNFMGSVEWFLGTHFQWHKQKMKYPSISAKQALQRILLRTTMLTFVA